MLYESPTQLLRTFLPCCSLKRTAIQDANWQIAITRWNSGHIGDGWVRSTESHNESNVGGGWGEIWSWNRARSIVEVVRGSNRISIVAPIVIFMLIFLSYFLNCVEMGRVDDLQEVEEYVYDICQRLQTHKVCRVVNS